MTAKPAHEAETNLQTNFQGGFDSHWETREIVNASSRMFALCGWAAFCGCADPCGEISKKKLFATIFVKLTLFCGEKSLFSLIATLHRREQGKKLSEFLLKMVETRRLLTKTYNDMVNF